MNCTHLFHVCIHVYFYVCVGYENVKVMLRGEKVILKEVESWVMEYMWQDTEEGKAGRGELGGNEWQNYVKTHS